MGFKRFDPEDFVVSAQAITATCWSGGATQLTSFFTQSNQVSSITGKYYTTVFQTGSNVSDVAAEAQFQIAFANQDGGGALAYNNAANAGVSPASTIYGQYQNLVLEDENAQFEFGTYSGSYFYVLSVERARYKEALLPGSFNLTLRSASNYLRLTDNSGDVTVPQYFGTQRAYQIVSGSDGKAFSIASGSKNSQGYTNNSGSYGLFLPDTSTVLLNGAALDASVANGGLEIGTVLTSNTNGNNNQRLFNAINSGSKFALNSEETITSDFVFVRARNSEFNYSENPSYISGSTGEVIYNYFINNPQTYVTSIGLYNDSNDLLAIAKLSKPLNKDFTKEALVRVKLDF